MGVKTAEVLITEGVRLAGREYDATDTRPLSDLIDWLSSVALGWPWSETMSNGTFDLASGTRTILIGGTATNLTGKRILRVNFPLEIMYGPDLLPDKIYQEAYTASYDAYDVGEGNPDRASYVHNIPGLGAGIVFNRKPKTTIRIRVPYQFDPTIDVNEVADIPWYPNDLTIKQSVAFYTARHHDGPTADKTLKFEDDLAIMIKNDKLKFGVVDSFVMKMNRSPRTR